MVFAIRSFSILRSKATAEDGSER